MDKTPVVIAVLCLVSQVYGAGDLTIILRAPTQIRVQEGDPFNITCSYNKGLEIFLKYETYILHKSLVGGKETELAKGSTLTGHAHPDTYEASANFNQTNLDLSLKISHANAQMDGKFICRAIYKENTKNFVEDSVEVVVFHDVSDVTMEFGGENIIDASNVAIEKDQGEYYVSCQAKGFNDKAKVTISLDGKHVDVDVKATMLDDFLSSIAGARRYSVFAETQSHLIIRPGHNQIECEAVADFSGARPLIVSAPLQVISKEPVIVCDDNVSATPEQKYVKISCLVTHSDIQIASYRFVFGDTGEIITPDGPNDRFDEVRVEVLNEGETKVTLDLYKVNEWNFETEYYLDVYLATPDRTHFRKAVALVRIAPSSAATVFSSSVVVVFALCAIILLLLGL